MSDALNELRAKYYGQPEPDPDAPKVFHLFTREAYVPPPEEEKAEELAPGTVDEQSLKVALGITEDFEEGICRGIALVTWNEPDGVFETHVSLPIGLKVADGAARMLGALAVLTRALTDIAEGDVEVLASKDSPTAEAMEKSDGVVMLGDDDLEPDA